MLSSSKTGLSVSIADLIIAEGLSFKLSQKPRWRKVLDFASNVSKAYNLPKGVSNFFRCDSWLLKKTQLW